MVDVASDRVIEYRHPRARRKNNPPAGLASQGRVSPSPADRYAYDPHLPPVLRFDPAGGPDQLPPLLQEARERRLTEEEVQDLAAALRKQDPWLEWTGKRERRSFEVDPVALHIHERVSARAIIAAAGRRDIQRSFFADPQQTYREAVQFYRHDVDWTNRMILGDSLMVMHSLAKREALAGQIQMIFLDPPYGIRFGVNFQPLVRRGEVKDRDQDLSREPEVVKAYRDTWELGVHSYLSYLRDRLIVARELLRRDGSIFVQIGDENVHLVRNLLDEVFGPANFISSITFATTSGFESNELAHSGNFLLWYGKDRTAPTKVRTLYEEARRSTAESGYRWVMLPDGTSRALTAREARGEDPVPDGGRLYLPDNIQSQGAASSSQEFAFRGNTYLPGANSHWKAEFPEGMDRLRKAGRIHRSRNSIRYVRFADDFAWKARTNIWTDTLTGQFTEDKVYVVQTNTKVVERCMLLATDPGDLVLDPTCGSGTTAYVAEHWGRRWITIDTSRVSLAIARQRLLTASHEQFVLKDPDAGPAGGFRNKTVKHVTLGSIGQNVALDPVFARHEPVLEERLGVLNAALARVSAAVRVELAAKLARKQRAQGKRSITEADRRRWLLPKEPWREWEVPYDTDPDWPLDLIQALDAYRTACREKFAEVNATVEASAEAEELVDQPDRDDRFVRVSGPFTVEAVMPAEDHLDLEATAGEPDEDLDTFGDGDTEAINAEAYLDKMLRLLRADGVRFPDNKQVAFARLDAAEGGVLHADGEWQLGDSDPRRVAVAFGPQYGPVTALQVEECIRTANRRGYDDLVFAGFSFDAAAQGVIQEDEHPHLRTHLAHISPDVAMDDLLKKTPSSQLFTVFGLPRTVLEPDADGALTVTLEGVDIYDPVENQITSTGASKVAAWFLDSDYDGRSFCVCQAFFPDDSAWEKLARDLKGTVDAPAFETFAGTTSLPFPPGPHRTVAVKVIDPRGNEVLRVHRLDGADG